MGVTLHVKPVRPVQLPPSPSTTATAAELRGGTGRWTGLQLHERYGQLREHAGQWGRQHAQRIRYVQALFFFFVKLGDGVVRLHIIYV